MNSSTDPARPGLFYPENFRNYRSQSSLGFRMIGNYREKGRCGGQDSIFDYFCGRIVATSEYQFD
jgi:hypothetical protein